MFEIIEIGRLFVLVMYVYILCIICSTVTSRVYGHKQKSNFEQSVLNRISTGINLSHFHVPLTDTVLSSLSRAVAHH